MKVVIRAGGVGSRLWPKSRESQPKQFQALLSDKTMLQDTWKRARKLAKAADIFVTTNTKFGRFVRAQLPELKAKNLILEPERRDSGPAMALEALLISHVDPDEIIVGFPSDHFIGDEKTFVKLIREGEKVLKKRPDHVLCLGVRPRYPATGLGYIRMGKQLRDFTKVDVFEVDAFKEKPDLATAKKFYKDWHYLWNAAYFMWRAGTAMDLFKEHAPKMYKTLLNIKPHIGKKSYASVLAKEFPKMEKIAADYVIIEPNKKLLVIPADVEWSDIGDWNELCKIGNEGMQCEFVGHDNTNIIVDAPKGKLVATFGLKNVAIVDTGDALLVCPLDRAPEVKQLVERMKENKKHHKFL